MIAQYVGRNHCSRDKRIPELQFVYNSARHDTTEYSSTYLNFGRKLVATANQISETHSLAASGYDAPTPRGGLDFHGTRVLASATTLRSRCLQEFADRYLEARI